MSDDDGSVGGPQVVTTDKDNVEVSNRKWPFSTLPQARRNTIPGPQIPRRGEEAHGVPGDPRTVFTPTPGDVLPDVAVPPESLPIAHVQDVRVVSDESDTGRRKHFATFAHTLGQQGQATQTPSLQIAPRKLNRTRMLVRAAPDNTAGTVVFVGSDDMNCNYPLFPGDFVEMFHEQAVVAFATAYARVYVYQEFDVEIHGETHIKGNGLMQ